LKRDEVDVIGGRQLSADRIQFLGNCRLVRMQKRLNQLLMMVEHEIEERSGKGGGGLK